MNVDEYIESNPDVLGFDDEEFTNEEWITIFESRGLLVSEEEAKS